MPRQRLAEPSVYTITVTATAVDLSNYGPGVLRRASDREASTVITIEGELDHPAYKELPGALLTVFRTDIDGNEVGGTLPGGLAWNVVLKLPPILFSDLLVVAMSGRLATVRLVTDRVCRGKARVRSASFGTVAVPLEMESEEIALGA